MKGQIPVIVALVILTALILSTLYFITSNTTVINQSYYGYTLRDWVLINEELDTLAFLSLKYGSRPASQVFNRTFYENYHEAYTSYPDGDYSYDFDASLQSFTNALNLSSTRASWVLGNASLRIINNWIKWKTSSEYIVKLAGFKAYYRVVIGMIDSTSTTYGQGSVGVEFTMDIVNPMGEYRRFHKSIEAGYRMEFYIGHPYGDAIHLPINVKTYIVLNGVTYYYMVPKQHLRLTMISNIFTRLPSLAAYTDGNTTNVPPLATFYHGSGVSMVMYRQNYTNLWDFSNDIINHLVYPTGSYWPYYPDGKFLWATISSLTIDQVTVFSALKIAFKYHYEERWGGWILWIGVQGDENAPIPY